MPIPAFVSVLVNRSLQNDHCLSDRFCSFGRDFVRSGKRWLTADGCIHTDVSATDTRANASTLTPITWLGTAAMARLVSGQGVSCANVTTIQPASTVNDVKRSTTIDRGDPQPSATHTSASVRIDLLFLVCTV